MIYKLECPCCGTHEIFREVFKKAGYPIVRCTACGVGRTVTENFSPEEYYTSDYFDGGHADGYADYVGSEQLLRNEFRKILQGVRRHVPGGKLLEVGCAYGFFLSEAQEHFETFGIEVSQAAVTHCHDRGLRNVHCGEVTEQLASAIGTVDVIVMLDVIEHLPDPAAVLQVLSNQLNPGGLIVLSTGDWASPLARAMGQNWRLMTPPQHLSFFTPRSLTRLLHRFGLYDVTVAHPWKSVPAPLIAFQAARMLGLGNGNAIARHVPNVGIPINLFDAMRATARKQVVP